MHPPLITTTPSLFPRYLNHPPCTYLNNVLRTSTKPPPHLFLSYLNPFKMRPTRDMPSPSPYSPVAVGIPTSPRANRQNSLLAPLDTSYSSRNNALTPSPYSGASEKPSPQSSIDTKHRHRDSLIFVNATIPISPVSSTDSIQKVDPYAGVTPRKRSPFARFFTCLGREERARRKAFMDQDFVKVGESSHWSEY